MVARAVSPTRAATSTRLASMIMGDFTARGAAPASKARFGARRTVPARQRRRPDATCGASRTRSLKLSRTLPFDQAGIVAAVIGSLIIAGFLKGIIGIGMPVVALPLLSLFIDVKAAAMLLSMPLIFSNLPQALEGGQTGRCLRQLMPVFLGMIPASASAFESCWRSMRTW